MSIQTVARHVLPFLTHADRKILGQTCVDCTIAKRTYEIEQCYKVLLERIDQHQVIFLQRGDHLRQEILGTVLGAGGSKKAIALSNGRALMVPNMDVESLYCILPRWQRMVYEETAMSRFLRSMNLLTPNSERVQLCFSEKPHAPSMPAYASDSFEHLTRTQGWHIIDAKNSNSSTWKMGENFLFKTEEDRLKEASWDSVVDPLLTDLAKLSLYDLGIGGDSLNLAIVPTPSQSYELRYFGFDLSHSAVRRTIPPNPLLEPDRAQITECLGSALGIVFDYEFAPRYASPAYPTVRDFKQQLIEKYVPIVLSKIEAAT